MRTPNPALPHNDESLERMRLQFESQNHIPPDPPADIQAKLDARLNYKHLNLFGGYYYVRLYYKGRYYCLWRSQTYFIAAQFADAAALHFWDYRGWSSAPADKDFNTSLNHAKHLLETWHDVRLYLHSTENHLRNALGWEKRAAKQQSTTQTLKAKIDALSKRLEVEQSWKDRLALAEERIQKLEAKLNASAS